MRFAISTSPQRTTWDWLLETWQRADQHEIFESGWTFDHLYALFGDSSDDCLDGWITLTALLQATERLRGGVLVTGMVYRHPGVLANMATTLDHTSRGRLELGVGAGWNQEECDAFGIPLGTMSERFDRFEEGLAVLDGLFANERTSFHGHYYELRDAMNNPKPVQARVPICIGGKGPKRTLPLAARWADHWNYTGESVEEFRRLDAILQAELATLGRPASAVRRSVLLRWSDNDELLHQVGEYAGAGADLAMIALPKDRAPSAVDELAELLPRFH